MRTYCVALTVVTSSSNRRESNSRTSWSPTGGVCRGKTAESSPDNSKKGGSAENSWWNNFSPMPSTLPELRLRHGGIPSRPPPSAATHCVSETTTANSVPWANGIEQKLPVEREEPNGVECPRPNSTCNDALTPMTALTEIPH